MVVIVIVTLMWLVGVIGIGIASVFAAVVVVVVVVLVLVVLVLPVIASVMFSSGSSKKCYFLGMMWMNCSMSWKVTLSTTISFAKLTIVVLVLVLVAAVPVIEESQHRNCPAAPPSPSSWN